MFVIIRFARLYAFTTDGTCAAAYDAGFEPGPNAVFVECMDARKSDILRVACHIFIANRALWHSIVRGYEK